MQRIKKISIANAQGKAKELLEGTKKAMGTELNLFSTFANSPAALEA
ncbi:TPA: carboxymuconolactone decarboxylase family protein, partial [Legionella pneumophila]|nr:carboxymuconolactone decarboxylase family protein [Legionella pneumophila]HAU1398060.1 carboxymuconolactone decarboxylase family protein [Legionella pneumophila]HCC3249495.1 carboxymuconolactone decarboxylase family protein [Legionella pneumophila]HEH5924892.1 carboxymuconolactone decarboxylase family protein [Legionella pneumophila]HEH5931246.1 carboxymuconolactone decarboxylase family protein [Legionella pneumophila]